MNPQVPPAIVGVLLTFTGILLDLFVMTSFFRFHWANLKQKTRTATFLVMFVSTIWASCKGPKYMSIVVNGRLLETWCQYDGFVVTSVAGTTVGCHVFLALERYFGVAKSRPLPWFIPFAGIAFIYSCLVVLASIHVWVSPRGYPMMESGIWCFYDYTSSVPIDRFGSTVLLVYCLVSVAVVGFFYFSVYWKTRQVSRELQHCTASKTSSVAATRWTHLERRVFHRCILLSGSFITFFTPCFMTFLYRALTGQKISIVVDFSTTLLAHVDSVLTPFLVCYMNSDFREATVAYLPVSLGALCGKRIFQTQGATAVATVSSKNSSSVPDNDRKIDE